VILLNEKYVGRWVYGRRMFVKDPLTGRRQARLRPRAEWQVTEHPALRLIEPDAWETVQAKFRRQAASYPRSRGRLAGRMAGSPSGRASLFSGVLQCGECGGTLVVVSGDPHRAERRYGCGFHREKGPHVCANALTVKLATVAYRMRLLGDKHARHRAALQLAVDKSGYGKTRLPAGRAWGVAVHESFESVVAYVVEASVQEGRPVLHRVTAGVHCNLVVNPRTVEAQVQGAAVMGLSMCLPGAAITLKDGEVQQRNYGDFVVPRITDMPQIAVHVVPSAEPPTGMGEPGLPPLAPAFANAIARPASRCANCPSTWPDSWREFTEPIPG
jgi:hypothetical protein